MREAKKQTVELKGNGGGSLWKKMLWLRENLRKKIHGRRVTVTLKERGGEDWGPWGELNGYRCHPIKKYRPEQRRRDHRFGTGKKSTRACQTCSDSKKIKIRGKTQAARSFPGKTPQSRKNLMRYVEEGCTRSKEKSFRKHT